MIADEILDSAPRLLKNTNEAEGSTDSCFFTKTQLKTNEAEGSQQMMQRATNEAEGNDDALMGLIQELRANLRLGS